MIRTGTPTVRAALLVLGPVLTVAAVLRVPWNTDEFLPYHPLACHQVGQRLNSFGEACGDYPTRLGPLHYERAYHYTGAISSVLLHPVFGLWHSLHAHELLGLAALCAVGCALSSSLGLQRRSALLVACYLPLVFSLVRDTGPVRVSLVVMAVAPLLVARHLAAVSPLRSLGWGLLLAVVCLLATEDKPFFVFLLPGIALWSVACLSVRQGGIGPGVWRRTAVVWCGAGAACAGLLGVTQANGVAYVGYLREATAQVGVGRGVGGIRAWGVFTLAWPDYGARVHDLSRAGVATVHDPVLDVPWVRGYVPVALESSVFVLLGVGALLVLVLYGASARRLWRRGSAPRFSLGLMLSSSLALGAGAWLAGGWAGHHFVFAQVPLLACVLLAVREREQHVAAAALAALSLLALATLELVPTYPWASSRVAAPMSRALEEAAAGDVVNCGTFGCFAPYALLARRGVPVTFAVTPAQTGALLQEVSGSSHAVIHVCFGCDLTRVRSLFAGADVNELPRVGRTWRAFRVEPRPR